MNQHRQHYLDANTRRHPRTMAEAFGPYESGPIEEPERPLDWQDKLVIQVGVVCAFALLLVVLS